MFSNLSWYKILLLLLFALFIFGDKLPQVVADGMRMLRNLRRVAQDATSDLSREFGTELRPEDLNPRTFVRRHLLSEQEQQALVQPFRTVSNDLQRHTEDLRDELRRTGEALGPPTQRAAAPDRNRRPGPNGGLPEADPAARPSAAPPSTYDDIT